MSDPLYPDFFIRLRTLADSAPGDSLTGAAEDRVRRDRLKCVSVSVEQLPPLPPPPPSEEAAHDAD